MTCDMLRISALFLPSSPACLSVYHVLQTPDPTMPMLQPQSSGSAHSPIPPSFSSMHPHGNHRQNLHGAVQDPWVSSCSCLGWGFHEDVPLQ